MDVLERIQNLLAEHGVPFHIVSHRPVYTSSEAAEVRGVSLKSGAKALIVKVKEEFVMLVLPGDRRLDRKKLRGNLGYKSVRFATSEEVQELTGLTPGAIPPFGSLFQLKTYCDPALGENEEINFNCGTHTKSMTIRYEDYLKTEKPTVVEFSEE